VTLFHITGTVIDALGRPLDGTAVYYAVQAGETRDPLGNTTANPAGASSAWQ